MEQLTQSPGEGLTEDQFRNNYLRTRIAQMTLDYEDKLSNEAIKVQILSQNVEQLQEELKKTREQLQELQREHRSCMNGSAKAETIEGEAFSLP